MTDKSIVDKYMKLGLEEKQANVLAESAKVAQGFDALLGDAIGLGHVKNEEKLDKNIALLFFSLSSTFPREDFMTEARKHVVDSVCQTHIKNMAQLLGAVEFFKKLKSKYTIGTKVTWDEQAYRQASGIGVNYTVERIRQVVNQIVNDHKDTLTQERYRAAPKLRRFFPEDIKFADGKAVEQEYDAALLKLLGPRTEEDNAPTKKKPAENKQAEKPAEKAKPAEKKEAEALPIEEADDFVVGREIPDAINTEEQKRNHLKATGGKVITRFPPEPNGFLHLGHAKAINFNFGVASRFNGETILRFDDTNPEAEDQIYIDNIIECVKWLGFKPVNITYSSDYFPELYDLAVKLIKKGLAYVCHQKGHEIEESRKNKTPSPWRDRSVEENLRLFERMRKGLYAEGEATLRMKQDITSPNPTMWDLVAYRIKYHPHPHVGDRWCIYPSYDFTHCIIDSLENITHSLCTLEFEVRRESYYWLINNLDLYKPKVWEYSRLEVQYNVMSKRRLKALVDEKWVSDWDDPRLITLMGYRRRGYPPQAINNFCSRVGVSRHANVISLDLLEHCVREYLHEDTPRVFVVQNPLKVVLTNWPENKVEQFEAPIFPHAPEKGGVRKMPLSRIVYIDHEDFRMQDEKDYYGLAPKKEVYLKYSYSITCNEVVTGANGEVQELRCSVDFTSRTERKKKVKGHLHWVSGENPVKAQVRLYEPLFTVSEPGREDDWRNFVNKDSLHVFPNAVCESFLASARPEDRFQFERLGFYCADFDSKPESLIFNRTVTLKDRKGKPGDA